MWRAIRYGQDGKLLDLEAPKIEEFPAAEAADRLKAWAGVDVALPELNGAQRQRRLIDGGASPYEVFKVCVDETRATYSSQEETVMTQPEPREFTDEEIAQIEAEMDKLKVDDVLLQTLVTLINLGARKAGLASPPGEEPEGRATWRRPSRPSTPPARSSRCWRPSTASSSRRSRTPCRACRWPTSSFRAAPRRFRSQRTNRRSRTLRVRRRAPAGFGFPASNPGVNSRVAYTAALERAVVSLS